MQHKQAIYHLYSPLQGDTYKKWVLPWPVVTLLTRLNNLLAMSVLTTALHMLEIAECEEDKTFQRITIGIKLRGWLNLELLKQQINTLFYDYNRNLASALTASLSSHRTIIDLPLAEKHVECQQFGPHEAQNYLILAANAQMYIGVSCLHQNEHALRIGMQQSISNTGTSTLLIQELLEVLFTNYPKTACSSSPERIEHTDLMDRDVQSLTERELEILTCVSQGFSNRAIAQECCITEGTVKRHMNNIYAKLNVRSRTQAVARVQSTRLLNAFSHEFRGSAPLPTISIEERSKAYPSPQADKEQDTPKRANTGRQTLEESCDLAVLPAQCTVEAIKTMVKNPVTTEYVTQLRQ
jgi:DNA-binding CsgD family transcriptional regulator